MRGECSPRLDTKCPDDRRPEGEEGGGGRKGLTGREVEARGGGDG